MSAIILEISARLLLSFPPSFVVIIFTLSSACVNSAVSPPNSLRHTANLAGTGRRGRDGCREGVGEGVGKGERDKMSKWDEGRRGREKKRERIEGKRMDVGMRGNK
jgi:hypothetical protein